MTDKQRDKSRGGKKTGGLDEDDRALWRRVTEGARPLRERPAAYGRPSEREASKPRPEIERQPPRAAPAAPGRKQAPVRELTPGGSAGVARSQVDRMRRGRLAIEARLDLHGHTQERAHRELNGFLARAQERGKRCVLIVTGKGLGKDQGGVLRRMVPLWLNQAPNRERVLAFDVAQPKDGGMGALYVLLKRLRKN